MKEYVQLAFFICTLPIFILGLVLGLLCAPLVMGFRFGSGWYLR